MKSKEILSIEHAAMIEERVKQAILKPEVNADNWTGLQAAGFVPLISNQLMPPPDSLGAGALGDIVATFLALESAFLPENVKLGDFFDEITKQPSHNEHIMHFYVRNTAS